MANVKISELPLTLSVSPTALIPVVQNGTTCSTYACLIAAGGVSGTSGTSGAAGAAGASGTAGTSGGFGAVIIAGSGTESSVRDGVSNVAAGNYSFAGGGLSNSVTPGVTTSSKTFAVTCNSLNSVCVTGNVTNFFPDTVTPTPIIGSSFQGGKVAYILNPMDPGYDPLYIKGLIAADADQSTGIQWWNGSNINITTSTDLGTGLANTDAVMAAQGVVYTDYAAGLARAYNGGGYNDWYLPSNSELQKLYDNNAAIGGFAPSSYWASSQGGDDTSAYYIDFSYGGNSGNPKSSSAYVRAIRSFSINAETGSTTVGAEFRGTAGTSGVTLNNWSSCYTYPTTALMGADNIGAGPYDNVVFTFTNNGAEKSSIVGGNSNVVNGSFSFIGGGGGTTYQYANTICNTADYSFIGAGQGNTIQSSGVISSFDQSSFVYTGTIGGTCTYSNLGQCVSSGSGTGVCVNVVFVDNVPSSVEINMGQSGANYRPDDTITISGASFMGSSPADDLTFSVYEVASANNSAILGGCNNTLAVGAPSFIAGTGININQVSCNYARCGGVPVPALYVNNLVFANSAGTSGIGSSDPGVCGQVYRSGGNLMISGY